MTLTSFINTKLLLVGPTAFHHFSRLAPIRFVRKWRVEKGLNGNPNSHGPLTDKPDFTYLDGRPTPYGIGQVERLVKQKQLAEDVKRLSGEIDFAVERHERMLEEKEEEKRRIIAGKLKPKGVLLERDVQNRK